MAKTFDRISSLLISPKSRIKYYNDKEIETILNKDLNKFIDVDFFEGRVVGLPADTETATFFPNSQQNSTSYNAYVYVRLDDIDDNFLPDPTVSKVSGADTIQLIMSHPVATLDPSLGVDTVLLGTKVQCSFVEGPANYGKQRNLVITKIYYTPDAQDYKNKILKKIGAIDGNTVASVFASAGIQVLGGATNNDDFAGRYNEAPAPVKRFLDDLLRIIKENNRSDLLPINVGSLYRSLESQATIMWYNVVEGGQAGGISWFNKTYGPKLYTSALKSAKPGTDYGFKSTNKKNRELGALLRKSCQHYVSLLLKQGIAKKLKREDGIRAITAQYEGFFKNYGVLPSRHNTGEAVDIRTNSYSRNEIKAKVYTEADKKLLEKLAKKSKYCIFAGLESLNKTGEHLHCSASPADEGGAE